MNTRLRFFLILSVVSIMINSCGGAAATEPPAPATEASVATEPPATEPPTSATEAPAATEPTATPPPVEQQSFTDLVVILVVDNFTSIEENEAKDGDCMVTPDGQGLSGGRGASMTILGQPHGLFVYDDLIQQVQKNQKSGNIRFESNSLLTEGEGFDGISSLDKSIGAVRFDLYRNKDKSDQALLVVAIDTNGFKIDAISNNIPAAIEFFSTNNVQLGDYLLPATQKIVVNMSFVLIPCNPEKTLSEALNASGISVDMTGWLGKLRTEYDLHGEFYEAVNSIPALVNLRARFNEQYSDLQKDTERGSERRKQLAEFSTDLYLGLPGKQEAFEQTLEMFSSYSEEEKQVLIDNAVFQAYVVYLLYYDGSTEQPPYPDDLRSIYDPYNFPPSNYWDHEGQLHLSLQSSLQNYPQVVYIGAAGNFGRGFPYAPASWDFVDSISSEESELHTNISLSSGVSLVEYSNWGEIRDNGDFQHNPMHIYGTSFAAPKFSYQIALYLLGGGGSPCASSPSILPVLGYATNKDPSFTDLAGTTITNTNLTYSDAMATYCP